MGTGSFGTKVICLESVKKIGEKVSKKVDPRHLFGSFIMSSQEMVEVNRDENNGDDDVARADTTDTIPLLDNAPR